VLGGTTSGTISSGANSVTISGVIYPAAETMTLRASATCLSPAVSSAITFSNASGQINIFNRSATGIASNQAVLNAAVGCPATDATVHVHWGTTNEGVNVAQWANSASPGTWNNVTSTAIGHPVTDLAPNTTYYYIFRATNASGTVWSSQVSSFKTLPLAPVITTHPAGATKVAGSPVSFTVTATDAAQYQWFKADVPLTDGGNVSGATTAILRLSSITTAEAGSYSVVVSNGGGSATSDSAVLTTVAVATLTWDANTSTANTQDGGGNWIGNNWHNGASNVTWFDYHNAVIGSGGAGGVINPAKACVNNLTFNSFTGTYTIDSDSLTVAGNLLFNASGTAKLNALMSGVGSLTKSGSGTLQFYGLSQNIFSGGTIINNGTLHLGAIIDGISPNVVNPLGTGPVTLNGGTIRFDRVTAANALTVNGGTLYSNNGWGATWSGPVTLNTTATVNATWNMTFNGTISGIGGFTKTGGNTLLLSGTNSFTGTNRITAGTLACSRAAALGSGPLEITSGAMANLNYSGTRVIASLTLGGTTMPPGTYGSTGSSAENKNDTYFTSTGTGTVTILSSTTTTLALTSGATPAGPGTSLTFTATVTGGAPTGSVAFNDGATLLGSGTLNGSFQASFTTSSLAIGSHSITAQYAGNASNAPSTSPPLAIQIISSPPPPPTNLLATPGSNHVALTWTLSTGASSYSVKRSTASGGPYTVIGNPAGAGYDDLTAVNGTTYFYMVSAINAAGESANSSQVSGTPALLASTTTLASSPDGISDYGTAVTFTATVTAAGGPATGTVTFKDGATVLGTGTLSAGAATLVTSTLAVANHSITAAHDADPTFAGSFSAPSAYVVTAKILSITGVTASNKVYDGNANATLNGGAISGGVVAGETVTLIPGSGTFASANAGTWAVTATGFALGGADAGNYTLAAQPAVPNATITPRPVPLTGTRLYDGTPGGGPLADPNKSGGGNPALAGRPTLVGRNVGAQAVVMNMAAAALVRSAKGNTGANAATIINVGMGTAPAAGNTMIAVIATRGTSANIVSSITQTGVANGTWVRASQSNNTSMTTEIWYAPNVPSGAGTAVTINQASFRSAAVVMEYSGVLVGSPLDQIAPGNSVATGTAAVTGTITATTQANELWIGGIGFAHSTRTLGTILNSFTAVDNAASTNSTAGNNARVYALQRVVSSIGAASSGGTISASTQWAGTIATFRTVTPMTLALTGSAAANYTLTGASGTVQITPKALTMSGLTASDRAYDGTSVATLGGTAALLSAEAPGAGTTGDGKPYTGDTVALAGTATGTFADPNVGTAKAVTVTGVALSGADSGNYTLTQAAGLTADITARPLTVTAGNQSKVYGQTLDFGSGSTLFTSSGLQLGETIGSVTLTCGGGDAAAGVAASPYPIMPGAPTGGTFTAGNCTIGYAPSTRTVSPAGQAITFGALATTTYGNAPFALVATADSGLAVIYMSSNPAVATISDNMVTLWKAGSTTITASQAGDTNYSAAIPVAQTLTVDAAATTTTLSTSGSPSAYGGSVTLTASVAPASSGGTVQFHDNAEALGDPVTVSSGQAQLVTSALATGNHSITATYSGTINYLGSTATAMTQTVTKADQTITFGPLADRTFGDAPFSLTATASSGLAVDYLSSDPAVASVAGNTVTILKAGSTTITASQPGDANHHAAVPVAQPLTVLPGTPVDYATWAAVPAQGLTPGVNDAPLDDPDPHGFANLLEFTLGGEPMVPSQAIQPKLTRAGDGTWAFEYDRSVISKSSTTQVVEYGDDLTGWTPLAIPADSAGEVTITPGATSDHVKVTLPAPGVHGFVRLKVSQ